MSTKVTVELQRLAHAEGLPLPAYQTAEAAGLDLMAAVPQHEPLTLAPGQYALVPTGLAIALPPGHEAQVRPRSGLAAKHGVTVLNSPGTIDADYTGPLVVLVINHGERAVRIDASGLARRVRVVVGARHPAGISSDTVVAGILCGAP